MLVVVYVIGNGHRPGLSTGVTVAVAAGVEVAVGLALGVAVGVTVGFAVGVGVAIGLAVGLTVGFAVAVGVGLVLLVCAVATNVVAKKRQTAEATKPPVVRRAGKDLIVTMAR